MEWLQQLQNFLDNLEEKQFYRYIGIAFGTLVLFIALLFFYYYRSVSSLHIQLEEINETRQKVQAILQKAEMIKQKKREVNAMLAKDENFKLKGYFQQLLNQLGLSNKLTTTLEVAPPTGEGVYNETTLTAQLGGVTMKDITMLLQAIERKPRVYTKELEITASPKNGNLLNVSLMIATLEPTELAKAVEA